MRLRALFAALLLPLLLASCDDGLSSLNEDPNNPTSVSPDLLLPYSIEQGVDNVLQPSIGLEFANLVVQHWARVSSTDPDRYIYSNGIFNFFGSGLTEPSSVTTPRLKSWAGLTATSTTKPWGSS